MPSIGLATMSPCSSWKARSSRMSFEISVGGTHGWNQGESAACEHGEATDIAAALNGDGLELKAGSKDNQDIVVIKQQGQGTQFVLLKIQRGKSGETI